MTRAISGVIIDVEDEPRSDDGADRRGAVVLAFALCLAFGSAFLGRDSSVAIPEAKTAGEVGVPIGGLAPTLTSMNASVDPVVTGDMWAPGTLFLPTDTTDVQFAVFPDWLANEQLPPAQYTPVRVRAASGLAVDAARPGDQRMVTWTERGTVYWLFSDRRDIADLVRLADSLR
jgi:hypothetical protein